ncbi:MAG: hypothetical protein CSB06_02585 [Bacteroidia bacterium]|nr:MAG: hypothetical protein CSB06_02585 [Bacteroidia bacterium]
MTDVLIITYLLLFSGAAFVIRKNTGYMSNLLQIQFSYIIANQMFRENQPDVISRRLLESFFFIGTAVFVWQTVNHFSPQAIGLPSLQLLMIAIVSIAGYTILRKALAFLIAKIFSLEILSKEYCRNIDFHNHLLGLFLLFTSPLIQFTKASEIFIYLSVFMIVANFVSQLIRFVKINILAGVTRFHIFLYLCALEIIPLIYVYKWLVSFANH